jgi:tetrahydromethanopterin S-methyltransferase subunit A
MALHENGVDPEKRSIVGADGAIPYIENIPDEGLDRFRSQFEMIDLIDVEDGASIQAKVKECIEKDPGAIEEEAMVIVIEEEGEEEEGEEIRPVAPETALIEARMRNIQTQVKMVGANQRIFAGMYAGKVQGLVVGLAFILTLGTILLLK